MRTRDDDVMIVQTNVQRRKHRSIKSDCPLDLRTFSAPQVLGSILTYTSVVISGERVGTPFPLIKRVLKLK